MTVTLGREAFALARQAETALTIEQRRSRRDAALAALLEARAALAEQAGARYASGARSAARDADRLEQIAGRLLATVDALEPSFDALDVARDQGAYLGPDGLRIERSAWRREEIAATWVEAFETVLAPEALTLLAAAVKLQTA